MNVLHPDVGEHPTRSSDRAPAISIEVSRRKFLKLFGFGFTAAVLPPIPLSAESEQHADATTPENIDLGLVKSKARNWGWDHEDAINKLSSEHGGVVKEALFKIACAKYPSAYRKPDEDPIDPLMAWRLFSELLELVFIKKTNSFDLASVEQVVAGLKGMSVVTRIASAE